MSTSEQILEEACAWFIDCNEGALDAAGREHFNQWLRQSPEHVRAYLEISAAWESADRLAGAPVTRASGRKVAPLLYALAAALLLAVGIGFMIQRDAYTTTTTGIGEQRSVVLADGSTVEIDASSRLRVRFSQTERRVEVIYGQALFQVKQETARPFIVVSSGIRVQAVGTQFDVYLKPGGTTVTVVEGRVAVAVADVATPVLLSAGEQLLVTSQTPPRPVDIDAAAATAWTQHRLVFDGASLAEAVAEFNRYNARQMIIADPSLAGYHIRGKFDARDPDRLLQFLRARFGVAVREQDEKILISR
jgi:transmembrane sensor